MLSTLTKIAKNTPNQPLPKYSDANGKKRKKKKRHPYHTITFKCPKHVISDQKQKNKTKKKEAILSLFPNVFPKMAVTFNLKKHKIKKIIQKIYLETQEGLVDNPQILRQQTCSWLLSHSLWPCLHVTGNQ